MADDDSEPDAKEAMASAVKRLGVQGAGQGAMPSLHRAAASGNATRLRELLDDASDAAVEGEDERPCEGVGEQDALGATALHAACERGKTQCARVLLDAGADRDACTRSGETPLHVAARQGHAPCVQLLLSAGADIHARTQRRSTPLHLAARFGRAACLQTLLDGGADHEERETDDWTALHLAARYSHTHCIRALLRAGADASAQDLFGRTPRDVAKLLHVRGLL